VSFKSFDLMDAILEKVQFEWKTADLLTKLDMSKMELVEAYAEENDLYASEMQLSTAFDTLVLPNVLEKYDANDQDAIDQEFNNWSDAIHTEGLLHDEQYMVYGYVGTHAEGKSR